MNGKSIPNMEYERQLTYRRNGGRLRRCFHGEERREAVLAERAQPGFRTRM